VLRIEPDLSTTLTGNAQFMYQLYQESQRGATPATAKQPYMHPAMRVLKYNAPEPLDLPEMIRQLEISKNKLMILRLLSRSDTIGLLWQLDQRQLVNGLYFLDRDHLIHLMMSLPKHLLIKMLLSFMSLKDLIKRLPMLEMMNILKDPQLKVSDMMRAMKKMEPKFIDQLLKTLMRQDMSQLKLDDRIRLFFSFKKQQILDAMLKLPPKALAPLILFLVQEAPERLERISLKAMSNFFEELPKANLIELFHIVPPDIIIDQFLSQLPDIPLMMVAAQIDDGTFESMLSSNNPTLVPYLYSQVIGESQAAA
jgi:hypothetical protein